MPITRRTRRPVSWTARAARARAASATGPSRTEQAWPVAITLIAAIVFIVFLVQATMTLALVMALATLVAGGIMLTLVAGTGWIHQLRHLAAAPRRRR
jgi:multidrug transporter EmrE-like cation transporter